MILPSSFRLICQGSSNTFVLLWYGIVPLHFSFIQAIPIIRRFSLSLYRLPSKKSCCNSHSKCCFSNHLFEQYSQILIFVISFIGQTYPYRFRSILQHLNSVPPYEKQHSGAKSCIIGVKKAVMFLKKQTTIMQKDTDICSEDTVASTAAVKTV
jgi:hypothetical protein